jgi:hypothetical protein
MRLGSSATLGSLEEVSAMKRFARCVTLAGLFGVAMLAFFAPGAGAKAPVPSEFTFDDTGVLADVCAFPVTIRATGSGRVKDFFDASGTLTREQVHVNEQTTFSANGNSLTSLPFTYEVTLRFDSSGNVTDAVLNGVIVKVPLPDGGLFISAGRVDLLARGLPQFINLTPDVGATVNLDKFCEALAP